MCWNNNKKSNDTFQRLVQYTITSRIHPDEAAAINYELADTDFRKCELVRCLQIFRDSLEIALVSKKRDVAESRLEATANMYAEAFGYSDLLNSENKELLEETFMQFNLDFFPSFYLNIASPHLEKAKTLKTERGRIRHWNQAREILEEGLNDPMVVDTTKIKRTISEIPII